MPRDILETYLADRSRLGPEPDDGFSGAAGGAACGDLIRISVTLADGVIERVSFDAEGCAAARAAGAATAEAAEGLAVLDAARIGSSEVAEALGGLAVSHLHAAQLAADALHRAISVAASSGLGLVAGPPGAPAAERGGRAQGARANAVPERVLVALSGGVDSAVAALLEAERGADVVAVTVKLWADQATDGERSCCSPEAVLGARALAHSLGIPHLTLDLQGAFRAQVVDGFIAGYAAGVTPNPCVRCNGEVRIDAMIALADRIGATRLVTGHYARLVDDGEGPLLARAADDAKDQTHMLSALRAGSLARLGFPLGDLTKPRVRELAERAGLSVAGKAESQDLCFLAGTGKREFLRRHGGIEDAPGEVVDTEGKVLGTHPGHHNFTVGQRRGHGVAGPGGPLYVLSTDASANRVVVGPRERLAESTVRLRGARLLRSAERVGLVRLRNHAKPLPCKLRAASRRTQSPGAGGPAGEFVLELGEPAYGVSPGQTASLLDGDLVVGHGTIA